MKDCPRCFWLTIHGEWKRPAGIFPSLPNGMDGILKTHFDKFRDKGELPPELCEDNNCESMRLFEDKELLEEWRNYRKGILWKDDDGNILKGAVDNILQKGEKLIVLDYKTRGYPLKETTAQYSQDQLDIYTFLLNKAGYPTEDYGFLLFYIPKEVTETGEVIFDTELVKMNVNPKRAQEIFEKAIKLLNQECPEYNCLWCNRV